MNKWQEMYQNKLAPAEEIVKNIQSGDVCASACALGEPLGLVDALAEHAKKENKTGITHHLLLTLKNNKYLSPEYSKHVKHVSWFTSGFSRKPVQEGIADFMPVYYHDAPMLWRRHVEADVFYAVVSPMDKHGWFSFGASTSNPRAQMERAKKIYLEVNENMPRTHGRGFVHIAEVDAVYENHVPLMEMPDAPISEKDKIVGDLIAERIPDGATIQLGIGGIPNAVAKALEVKKDLGIHSEMFTEGMVNLFELGVVNNKNKNINRFKAIAGFAVGTRRMYDFLDDNPGVEFHAIDYVNNVDVIASHDDFVSINATLEVDLIGQVCSESIGTKQFSGTGGQADFVRGAGRSKGGKSFITTYATAKDDTISKIKPTLTEGAHVTCTKNEVDHIVTEFGVAQLRGKSASERAKALIEIAHPNFREELTHAARKMHLLP